MKVREICRKILVEHQTVTDNSSKCLHLLADLSVYTSASHAIRIFALNRKQNPLHNFNAVIHLTLFFLPSFFLFIIIWYPQKHYLGWERCVCGFDVGLFYSLLPVFVSLLVTMSKFSDILNVNRSLYICHKGSSCHKDFVV